MGITIGFEGRLPPGAAFQAFADQVTAFAAKRGWSVTRADRSEATLTRYFDEEEFSITGPVHAVIVTAHDDCDPIRLEFDSNWLVQDFVKTQFAGPEVHRAVVEFFREIEPCFAELQLDDEAEFWETGDLAMLEAHFRAADDAIAASLRSHPGAEVKVKTPEGRIMDLVVNHNEKRDRPWWQFWRGAG